MIAMTSFHTPASCVAVPSLLLSVKVGEWVLPFCVKIHKMPELEKLKADIATLPEEAQQLVSDFVAFLKQRYPLSPSAGVQPLNLENEPFVGIWSDRPEMEDSTAWVRQVRQQHWRT